MASSGSITTGQKEGRSVTLSWTLSSQNIANNTSTIAWTLKGSGSASGWVMSGGFKAVINGTTVYSSSTDSRIQLKNGTVVASGSLTIAHNSDGTKSFNLSCEAGVYTYAVSVSASGTHNAEYHSKSILGISYLSEYGKRHNDYYLKGLFLLHPYADLCLW